MMSEAFFEAEVDWDGNSLDNGRYFTGTKIMDCGDDVLSRMGKYPVISLSLKSAKQTTFRGAFLKLREDIIREYDRHSYILRSDIFSEESKKRFRSILNAETEWEEKSRKFKDKDEENEEFLKEVDRFSTSLKTLSEYLARYHEKNTRWRKTGHRSVS